MLTISSSMISPSSSSMTDLWEQVNNNFNFAPRCSRNTCMSWEQTSRNTLLLPSGRVKCSTPSMAMNTMASKGRASRSSARDSRIDVVS